MEKLKRKKVLGKKKKTKKKKKSRPKERKSTILSGKEKNSFVKAAGTGRAPRWRPDFEKKKSSSNQNLPNMMYKTRFPFLYASISLDTKT